MRVLAAAILFTLLSGCLASDDPSGSSPGGPAADGGTPGLAPADIVHTGSLQGVGYQQFGPPVDPLPACALEDRQCATYDIQVPNGTWNVTFTLRGEDGTVTGLAGPAGVVASATTDYDLFVEGVGASTNAAGEDDVVQADLDAGTYSVQVLAWNDVDGRYTLTVHFEA